MNERIRELIEDCTDRHFSECSGGFETFDKEKFAELIVRECAKACEYNEAPAMLYQLTAGQYALIAQGRKTAAYLVKEHFGVDK